MTQGWGLLPWGAGPWGAGGAAALELLSALAIRENVVRLTFNVAPQFTMLLTPNDASNPKRYQFVPLAEPVGLAGEPARPVLPVLVERPRLAGAQGAVLEVTLDRPMTPWPSRYRVAVNQLVSVDGALLLPGRTSFVFEAVYRQLRPQSASSPTPSRDVANPQTYQAQLDPLPQAGDPLALGVIPIDASGDYAFDEGMTQLKKRVFRRLLTKKGAFPALPGYGVGIPSYGKRLGIEGIRQQIVEEAQVQLRQEPDVAAVRVSAFSSPQNAAVTIFRVRIRVAGTGGDVQFDIPFTPV